MPGVIGIIQARLRSSRLPGKILAPLAGHPLLAVLAERLRGARVDEWWLATSAELDDDVTAAWGEALGLRVHRGHPVDVLSRFTAVIRARRPDWILRITADDPFTDAGVANALLDALPDVEKDAGVSLLGLGETPLFPLGYAPQLARAGDVLASESAIPAGQDFHRSHVLSWLRARGAARAASPPEGWPSRPQWRWTVDTPEDLRMARAAFACFGERWGRIGYPEMVAALDAHPEIPALNAHVRQKKLEEG